MPAKKSIQKTQPPATKKKTPQEFQKAYEALCKRYGYQLQVVPVYMVRDDGTFSTVLQVHVGEFIEQGNGAL